MNYRLLPGTGLKVSEVCLGTMTFGDQLAEKDAIEAVAYAKDQGINFIDTADCYFHGSAGASETILGKAIKPIRNDIVLATKCGGPVSMDVNGSGLSRYHVMSAVEGSLKRLDTDYVDILYYHFPDWSVSVEEIIITANDLIRTGKIRYWGVSNHTAWQTLEVYLKAKEMHMTPPAMTESVYNLLTRGIEDEMVPMLRNHPMGLVTYNPLAGGLLTGKHRKNAPAPDSRFDREKGYAARYFHDNNLDAVEELNKIAEASGYNIIEMSLKWLLAHDNVTSVIVGFSRLEQLQQNLGWINRPVHPLPVDKIDAVWKILNGNRYSYHQ